MLLLSLDLSTHTGWAIFEDNKLKEFGLLEVKIDDFDVSLATESRLYPWNLIKCSQEMGEKVSEIYTKFKPDKIIIR
jgi:hypothetical protein